MRTLIAMFGSIVLLLAPEGLSAADAPDPDKLLQERAATAREGMEVAEALYAAGQLLFDQVTVWARRLRDAELAIAKKPKDRVAALEAHLKQARKLEELADARQKELKAGTLEVTEMKYLRVEAEIDLEKAKKDSAPNR